MRRNRIAKNAETSRNQIRIKNHIRAHGSLHNRVSWRSFARRRVNLNLNFTPLFDKKGWLIVVDNVTIMITIMIMIMIRLMVMVMLMVMIVIMRKSTFTSKNRPFYSCLLGDLAFVWQRG